MGKGKYRCHKCEQPGNTEDWVKSSHATPFTATDPKVPPCRDESFALDSKMVNDTKSTEVLRVPVCLANKRIN